LGMEGDHSRQSNAVGRPEDELKRRMVVDLIPFLAAAYVKAQSAFSPSALLSSAVESYQRMSSTISRQEESLKQALRGVEELNIRAEGRGLALDLDRKEVLEIARAYLMKEYIGEGSHGSSLVFDPPGPYPRFDAALRLPLRSVFISLSPPGLTTDLESYYLERAVDVAPSQVWVFTPDDANVDSRLNPVFTSENRVLFGRLRILGLGTVIEDYLGRRYHAKVEKAGELFKVSLVARGSA